ncbi:GCN5-related N-acetyltransferase [Catenulispora acidiphila DSM 44928]|uniref:GCN5-related N-acetyltransferase n=1 Tax=Catenulispora acidiphila (strain DSM 44928 / JCM 14897 / NBRC 102108 / NRRL B-24433 / ID139908) TaxID=479433 RepID=C7PY12_CATAD|nr:GNAT family N-acetyltransferase [Catenulispora acidiphila]ACU73472.1 GCN5-related N-acetyltransferase [Catenulispora acidiphila DSM 44928]
MTDERLFPIRPASAEDYAGLAALELAADAVFEQFGIWPLPQTQPLPLPHTPDFTDAAAVLVAGRPPVGFARLDLVGAVPHIEQLSVHPAFVRRGLGTALVQACCDWAVSNHHSALTLTTFADVPFNAPFYARLGFTVIDPAALPEPLAALRRHEAEIGLDALGPRVAMRCALPASGPRHTA